MVMSEWGQGVGLAGLLPDAQNILAKQAGSPDLLGKPAVEAVMGVRSTGRRTRLRLHHKPLQCGEAHRLG
jgi:hypothetical protein